MIKYILTFVAIVSIGLIYAVSTKKTETIDSKQLVFRHKPDIMQNNFSKEKVLKKKNHQEVSTTKIANTNRVTYSHKVKTMGGNITQEDIDNAGSDEERERLIDDMAYAQTLEKNNIPLPNELKILKIIEKDLKHENLNKGIK